MLPSVNITLLISEEGKKLNLSPCACSAVVVHWRFEWGAYRSWHWEFTRDSNSVWIQCLRSVYSWRRRKLGLLNSSFCYIWEVLQVRQKYFFRLFRWYFETNSVCEKNYKIFFSLFRITIVFSVSEVGIFILKSVIERIMS